MTVKEAAREYYGKGFSIIPLNIDKTPAVTGWKEYQESKPPEELIKKWWVNGSGPGIGIITGKLSGVVVVDVDDKENGFKNLAKYISPGIITPMAKTPTGGYHLYFKHPGSFIGNKRNAALGLDFQGDGGYAVAPPTHAEYKKKGKFISGDYVWVKSFEDVALADLPEEYISFISSFSSYADVDSYKNKNITDVNTVNNSQQLFVEGRRDEDMFHLANILEKGYAEDSFFNEIMLLAARSCIPPYPEKDIQVKIRSARERALRKERNLSQEVNDFVLSTTGNFLSTEVQQCLHLSTRSDKQNIHMILKRLSQGVDPVIAKFGNRNGSWIKIDRTIQKQEWWNDAGKHLALKFPLHIDRFAKVFPGNIILLEGEKSQGKSTFALEFSRLNRHLFPNALFQNVEMADSEILDRFRNYNNNGICEVDWWKENVPIIKRTENWHIPILPDGLNVVDYLLEYEQPFLLPKYIFEIHKALKQGIALVCVQRDPYKPYPVGGRGTRDIPRLILSIMGHVMRIEDAKSFHYVMDEEGNKMNPSGLSIEYKQIDWCKWESVGSWQRLEEKKYAQFKK